MANEWINTTGAACYDSTGTFSLVQANVMEVDKLYALSFTISGLTQGALSVPTIDNSLLYTADGDYIIIGLASYIDLVFVPSSFGAGMFDGCIDTITLGEAPMYAIKDCNDNVIFQQVDETGVTSANGFVQYTIDWSDLAYGIYYLDFENSTLTYQSDCFDLKLLHNCTKQITWNNDSNAFEFNYSDLSFTQTLRIAASLWKPKFKALQKDIYEYSNGELDIRYVSKAKEYTFTTEELPEYIHDALSLALDSDNFFIDGIKYVFPDDETSPAYRNSSNLAPLEVALRKSQNLVNASCG